MMDCSVFSDKWTFESWMVEMSIQLMNEMNIMSDGINGLLFGKCVSYFFDVFEHNVFV